ncbi:biotin-dependent carboxyltransferase family protein [Gordonia rubripertincta]|uniref:5-oxoprolinase subunit C family protein n=1 Tax=Gordonia rubripertincta TaxID=36822 RepID=UPI0015FAE3E4|nr:biotin-dependent carboxyltransferase family protein [Gordonia rubripertincta]QMU22800.1 biotin-dependent carboxyltransferase [Gordonia rubripertincta]
MITIIKPGLQTTVQDLGRPGKLTLAMPPAGALDQFAHRIANALVGNGPEAATLEAALMGPTLVSDTGCIVAVTGADVDVIIDGVVHPSWTAMWLPAGSELRLGPLRSGARAYIAFAGGIDVPVVMGSRSTYMLSGIGGFEGRALRAKDVLPLGPRTRAVEEGRRLPVRYRPTPSASIEARIVLGLAAYRFTPESLRAFTEREYQLSPESNRTGYRFVGEPLDFVEREAPFGAGDNPSNVVSLGYPLGSIQVPNGSEPICLLRDAVTGGGFVTLGTVVSADLDLLAQAKAPDRVKFTAVDIDTALKLRHEHSEHVHNAVAAIV